MDQTKAESFKLSGWLLCCRFELYSKFHTAVKLLMTVFCNIHHYRLPPAEQKVAETCAKCHGDAQVTVVGHEHQHEKVADYDLDDVQKRLDYVCKT